MSWWPRNSCTWRRSAFSPLSSPSSSRVAAVWRNRCGVTFSPASPAFSPQSLARRPTIRRVHGLPFDRASSGATSSPPTLPRRLGARQKVVAQEVPELRRERKHTLAAPLPSHADRSTVLVGAQVDVAHAESTRLGDPQRRLEEQRADQRLLAVECDILDGRLRRRAERTRQLLRAPDLRRLGHGVIGDQPSQQAPPRELAHAGSAAMKRRCGQTLVRECEEVAAHELRRERDDVSEACTLASEMSRFRSAS